MWAQQELEGIFTSFAARKNVHEGGLASPADPHEAREDPRPERSADALQQLQLCFALPLLDVGILRPHALHSKDPTHDNAAEAEATNHFSLQAVLEPL